MYAEVRITTARAENCFENGMSWMHHEGKQANTKRENEEEDE